MTMNDLKQKLKIFLDTERKSYNTIEISCYTPAKEICENLCSKFVNKKLSNINSSSSIDSHSLYIIFCDGELPSPLNTRKVGMKEYPLRLMLKFGQTKHHFYYINTSAYSRKEEKDAVEEFGLIKTEKERAGELYKKSKTKWKLKYFILDKERIFYYSRDKKEQGDITIFSLEECKVCKAENEKRKHCFIIQTPTKNIIVSARSQIDMDGWMKSIYKQATCISENKHLQELEKKIMNYEKENTNGDSNIISNLRTVEGTLEMKEGREILLEHTKDKVLIYFGHKIGDYKRLLNERDYEGALKKANSVLEHIRQAYEQDTHNIHNRDNIDDIHNIDNRDNINNIENINNMEIKVPQVKYRNINSEYMHAQRECFGGNELGELGEVKESTNCVFGRLNSEELLESPGQPDNIKEEEIPIRDIEIGSKSEELRAINKEIIPNSPRDHLEDTFERAKTEPISPAFTPIEPSIYTYLFLTHSQKIQLLCPPIQFQSLSNELELMAARPNRTLLDYINDIIIQLIKQHFYSNIKTDPKYIKASLGIPINRYKLAIKWVPPPLFAYHFESQMGDLAGEGGRQRRHKRTRFISRRMDEEVEGGNISTSCSVHIHRYNTIGRNNNENNNKKKEQRKSALGVPYVDQLGSRGHSSHSGKGSSRGSSKGSIREHSGSRATTSQSMQLEGTNLSYFGGKKDAKRSSLGANTKINMNIKTMEEAAHYFPLNDF